MKRSNNYQSSKIRNPQGKKNEQRKHGPLQSQEVESGATEALASSTNWSHPRCALFEIGKTKTSEDNSVNNKSLTIIMKNVTQYST